ncbi:MAG: uroporphyrinogen-III C-methyltransferase [Clostridium sp.]|uniref:uroporphyrinogen-III C-methyltransferase n=1 Tax=Clostridium sp. TaxID=1506 RepID=UPI00305C8112
MGRVYLIGGGPGAPDLITLRAINVLKNCTAILYDRLSGEEILKYVNKDAKLFYCGKEPGCHYKTQEEINETLVNLAKEGHTVGRIKGGDPYIFGRGGEEALELLKENIEFEVVPGITSPISALNYGGIPVTHRKIAQSFHVFTGKSAAGLNLDFDTIAKLTGTLIFMMSYEQLGAITEGLIRAGLNETTPVAVVMNGTTAKQKKAIGTLKDITVIAKERNISNPAIIVVGQVVQFNNQLNWFEKLPLFGRNICITRSKAQSKELYNKLRELGATVTEINSIDIKATPENIISVENKLHEYKYILLTSVNGVNMLFNALHHNKIDIRKISGDFISIGDATTKALEERGIIPILTADEFTGEGLFKVVKPLVSNEDKILLPRSRKGRLYLVDELRKLGAAVDDVAVYDTIIGENHNVNSFENCDTVIFTSPTTVENMIALVGIDEIKKKLITSIGPITSKVLASKGFIYTECSKPGIDGIIKNLIG